MKKLALLLLVITGTVSAATFNLFTPATGVLKGNASTYVTTAAISTDIRSLWTGTCDSSTYLRGDGSCQAPPGAGGGTVNSVAFSAPSMFSVTGSPVTTSGTLALTFAGGQPANQFLATPSGTTGAVSLRALTLTDLPNLTVAKGGTGVTTLTGVAKGNGTGAFTAAASADIYGLWSGTCSASTFLRGDGSCQTPATGSGTVTSVALTVPSGFSVTGSPVTTAGTLAITGTLNPAAGGTGVATLTGIAKGNGTSAFTAAASGDVRGLWGGTCDATTYLRGDGSCVTPPTGGTSANPSATIGLTAVNGSAGTFLRSDGAPALSQAISPTWTGLHTFNGSGQRVAFTGAGTSAAYATMANTSGGAIFGVESSVGGEVLIGTPAYAAAIGSYVSQPLSIGAGNTERIRIASAGNVTINAPSSGTSLSVSAASAGDPALNLASGTLALNGAEGTAGQVLTSGGPSAAPSWSSTAGTTTGSFTGTFTGLTTGVTATFNYRVSGNIAYVWCACFTAFGTSNTSAMTITGIPSAIQPGHSHFVPAYVFDNGVRVLATLTTGVAGTWTFNTLTPSGSFVNDAGAFTTSGGKGVPDGFLVQYPLD